MRMEFSKSEFKRWHVQTYDELPSAEDIFLAEMATTDPLKRVGFFGKGGGKAKAVAYVIAKLRKAKETNE